jgi:glycosyltransferase involved in cell wall biosynthesis
MPDICLVTPGHPSKNPRLVKEAGALTRAGYDVHVIAGDYHPWGHEADDQFRGQNWSLERVAYGSVAHPVRRLYLGGRKRVAERLARGVLVNVHSINLRAYHWIIPELIDRARGVSADLFIAHYLPALPAAVQAAREQDAEIGFDAEDFHRGQYTEAEQDTLGARLTCWFEDTYIPRCDYVTVASPGIGEAYADALGIKPPTTILNVFPRNERSGHTPPAELENEHPGEGISLYWYSQTIGPGRGLETIIRAMGRANDGSDETSPLTLSLRGSWASGYEDELRALACSVGLDPAQVRHLDRAPPNQLIERAAQHDIGLALEQAASRNRDLCITNKIFAYLLAGRPVLTTDTMGQRWVHEHVPDGVALCPVGDVDAMAEQLRTWAGSPETRRRAAEAARHAADERFHWGVEKDTLLSTVRSVLDR